MLINLLVAENEIITNFSPSMPKKKIELIQSKSRPVLHRLCGKNTNHHLSELTFWFPCKQCGSRSASFFRSWLIRIYTVCHAAYVILHGLVDIHASDFYHLVMAISTCYSETMTKQVLNLIPVNPLKPNGISQCYQLEQSIYVLRDVGCFFSILIQIQIKHTASKQWRS